MSEYKLIACDLDGTLMRDDMSISEENLRAISEIAVRGVEFVPCTGRTLCEIPEAVRCHPDVYLPAERTGSSRLPQSGRAGRDFRRSDGGTAGI